jgi:hypothetical protein
MTIATTTLSAPSAVEAFVPSSSTMVAEKVIREGVYRDYEVDVAPQQYDDARSTFKPAKETKTNKGEGWRERGRYGWATLVFLLLICNLAAFSPHREIHCASRYSHCRYVKTPSSCIWGRMFMLPIFTDLVVTLPGSFIIPMAQYFWYVRDDDSTDKFFGNGKKAPPPPVKPKKKRF